MMLTLLSASRNSHSLSPEAKPVVIDSLNKVLATLLDLKLQVKQAHWNLKGPHFMPLHPLFDTFARVVKFSGSLFKLYRLADSDL